jgi:hypothetical protein
MIPKARGLRSSGRAFERGRAGSFDFLHRWIRRTDGQQLAARQETLARTPNRARTLFQQRRVFLLGSLPGLVFRLDYFSLFGFGLRRGVASGFVDLARLHEGPFGFIEIAGRFVIALAMLTVAALGRWVLRHALPVIHASVALILLLRLLFR